MPFPTIPTAGAGRVLTTNQTGTSQTRTFPDLGSLTKNAGDLLIAVIVAYQSSTTNAQFSSWGGGFTEFHDSGTGTTLAIGAAYKWSTGSETGTFTVTQAATVTGDASMMLLSIPGAHLTTPPEAGGRNDNTTAAADAASFDPSGWATENALWILIGGSGMTSGTGSWTALGSTPPANYTNWVDSNTTDNSAVGQTEIGAAFRQLQAGSDNPGTISSVDVSNARNSALLIAVRPAPVTAQVVTPITDGIVTSGRVTRKGAVVTPETFGAVTSGFIPARLQVSWAEVETPEPAPTINGSVVTPFTFGATTSGKVTAKAQSVVGETVGITTSAKIDAKAASASTITDSIVTVGKIDAKAAVSLPLTFGELTIGRLGIFDKVDLALALGETTDGHIPDRLLVSWAGFQTPAASTDVLGQVSTGLTFDSTTVGRLTQFGRVNPEAGRVYSSGGYGSGHYGGGDALLADIVTDGIVGAHGSVESTFTFSFTEDGAVPSRLQVSWASLATPAIVPKTGEVIVPLAFSSTTAGIVTAKGASTLPISIGITDTGRITARSAVSLPITLGVMVDGTIAGLVTGRIVIAETVGITTAGKVTAKAASASTYTFSVTSSGAPTKFGQIVLPLSLNRTVAGMSALAGRSSVSLVLGETTVGHVHAHASVSLPLTWLSVAAGHATLHGTLNGIPVVINIDTNGVANFVQLLDPIYSGLIGYGWSGGLGVAEGGEVSDTVAGVLDEELEEVLV